MAQFRLLGLLALLPATILLTLNFFVLFAVEKAGSRALKKLGRVVSWALWLCMVIILLIGLYAVITGQHPIVEIIRKILSAKD